MSDLQGYCTHSGCQEGRPRESASGSARERMGAWSVRGARAGGEARVYRVHDLPFMVRQSVPRTVLSQHARRDARSLHHCPSVALELLRLLLSLTHHHPLVSSVSVACLGDTWLSESCLQQAIIKASVFCERLAKPQTLPIVS